MIKKAVRHDTKGRWWILTLNNPNDYEDLVRQLTAAKADYATGQLEKGEQTGTFHFQFVIWFRTQQRFSYVKKFFLTAHIELCACPEKAVTYVTKAETRVGEVFVFGTLPYKRNSKTDWEAIYKFAALGQFENIPAQMKIQHYGNLQKIAKDNIRGLDAIGLRGVWLFGPPGSGKTHAARMLICNGDYYPKMCNKWWDGYQGQDAVVMDDLDLKGECLAHHLKIWADRWSFTAESKGTAIAPQHRVFVVTSNYLPEEIFKEDVVLRGAIERRFTMIKVLPPDPETGYRGSVDIVTRKSYETEVLMALLRSDFRLGRPLQEPFETPMELGPSLPDKILN